MESDECGRRSGGKIEGCGWVGGGSGGKISF